jgi:hypothetical protein
MLQWVAAVQVDPMPEQVVLEALQVQVMFQDFCLTPEVQPVHPQWCPVPTLRMLVF